MISLWTRLICGSASRGRFVPGQLPYRWQHHLFANR
jgi:hypothetical protein